MIKRKINKQQGKTPVEQVIFKSDNQENISDKTLFESLLKIKANECDVLYVHTGMKFGFPCIGRKDLLSTLYKVIMKLGVKTVIFPTFTFSFCNNADFNVEKTPSKMGALNEFIRKNTVGVRTKDPILSVFLCGDSLGLENKLSKYSIGEDSTYDLLHKSGLRVKFLFFGALMWECFTYTHYMEAIMKCPYRYNRKFSGKIITGTKELFHECYLYTSYGNVVLNKNPLVYNEMKARNQIHETTVGDTSILCFDEVDSFITIRELISKDPYYLTDGSFKDAEKNEIYNPNNIEVTSVL